MIKVIFFDIGGVYTNHTNQSTMERMAEEFGMETHDLIDSLKEFRKDFQTGRMNEEKYIEVASKKLGVDPADLERMYNHEEDFEIDQKIHDIILKLKKNGYFIATITDTSPFNFKLHVKKAVTGFSTGYSILLHTRHGNEMANCSKLLCRS